MREMRILASVLLPVIFGVALWIWNPDQNKMRTAAAVLPLSEAICSQLAILSRLGIRLPLWNIGPSMELRLRLDGIRALFSGLASLIWVLVIFFAFEYMKHEREEARFFGCLIMSLGALTGVAYTGNFVTLYLFFEMTTFLSVPLVFYSGKRRALRAGMVYLAYSILGTPIALGGCLFFHQHVCGVDFKAGGALVEVVETAQDRPQIILLLVFCMAAGFFYKTGFIPLHPWLPIAHPITPTPASAVLSSLITRAEAVTVIRVAYGMAGPTFLRGTQAQHVLLSMTAPTTSIGSMLAYKGEKLKRRLVCFSFNQVSYVLFGMFLLSMEGLHSFLLQMVFHTLIRNALFLCARVVICKTECVGIKEMRGMGRRVPAMVLCFALASLPLVGIPPVGGFLAKWHLAVGATRTETSLFAWLGPAVLMVSALLTTGYPFPVIVEGFFPEKDWKETEKSEAGRSCVGVSAVSMFIKVSLAVLGIPLLVLGALGKPIFKLLRGTVSATVWKRG